LARLEVYGITDKKHTKTYKNGICTGKIVINQWIEGYPRFQPTQSAGMDFQTSLQLGYLQITLQKHV
jgi:hypothetical protein